MSRFRESVLLRSVRAVKRYDANVALSPLTPRWLKLARDFTRRTEQGRKQRFQFGATPAG